MYSFSIIPAYFVHFEVGNRTYLTFMQCKPVSQNCYSCWCSCFTLKLIKNLVNLTQIPWIGILLTYSCMDLLIKEFILTSDQCVLIPSTYSTNEWNTVEATGKDILLWWSCAETVLLFPWRSSFISTHDLAKKGQMSHYLIILKDPTKFCTNRHVWVESIFRHPWASARSGFLILLFQIM